MPSQKFPGDHNKNYHSMNKANSEYGKFMSMMYAGVIDDFK